MEDRARGEKALRCAEDLLHHGQLLVAKHDFERREFSVGAQHEDAIEPGVLLGLGAIDDEALLAGGRQEAAITAIADERLVALLQLPFEGCENRGAVGGVLLGLLVIAADDVAPPGERHCLRLVVDALATSGDGEGHEGARIVEYQFAHQLVGALAHAENVKKFPRFEFRDGLGADHAAVGDDADATDGKAPTQPVHHRNEATRVRRVAGPHLRAHRSAVAVQEHGEDHLAQVRPVILGIAAPAERLPAGALEIETGRVHEHEIEFAEQVASAREQAFFNDVLEAARCKRGAVILFARRQLLAEPGHRPVEMMQVEPLDAVDPVILSPPIGRPVRSTGEQAMQHGEEDGTFERKPMLALPGELLDDGPASGLLPQPFEHQGGPDASHVSGDCGAVVDRIDDDRLGGEARAGSKKPFQLSARAQILDTPQRGDHLLADLRAVAVAFDDLQIGATAGGFLAEVHARLVSKSAHDRSMRHVIQAKSAMTWHYICAKPNPRLLKYQLLTAHTHAATVEDQLQCPSEEAEVFPTPASTVLRFEG